MRILTEIPDADVERLDALAKQQGRSRAAAIRDAVKLFLAQNDSGNDWIARGAGYWKRRTDIGDAVEHQRAMRDDRQPGENI